jgi:hypothetical protein
MINIRDELGGLGDTCMAGQLVSILRDNNIDAYLCENKHSHLLDVPITKNSHNFGFNYIHDFWSFKRSNRDSIMQQNIKRVPFNQDIAPPQFGVKITKNYVPVKFHDEKINSVQVVLNTKNSGSTVKGWSRFGDLKNRLDENKITWIDLDEENIYDNLSLNYVKYAKAYVGLDTGRSHYSSFFANTKGIIIQSGYNKSGYWCNYDYIFVGHDCCRMSPCFLDFEHHCNNKHRLCCKDISVDRVFDEIRKKVE